MNELACYISSVHTYYREDWVQCVQHAASRGFAGLEIFGDEGKTPFLEMPRARLVEVGAAARKAGIALSYHPWVGEEWCGQDMETLTHTYEALFRQCAVAGIGEVNMHLGFLANREQGVERVLEVTQRILPVLKETGITLYYENVPDHGIRELGSELWDFKAVFDRFGPETGIMLNIDIGHAYIMHELDAMAQCFGDRWRYTHVHDNNGLRDLHMAPGEGTLDFDRYAALAKNAGYTGPLMMEYHQKGLSTGMPVLVSAFEKQGVAVAPIAPEPAPQT